MKTVWAGELAGTLYALARGQKDLAGGVEIFKTNLWFPAWLTGWMMVPLPTGSEVIE